VPSAEFLAAIRSGGQRILELARSDPSRPVPQYPGWSMTDLATHVASIHGRTTLICHDHPTERISAPRLPEGQDVFDWYEANLEGMLAALEETDPEIPVWGFADASTIAFWERRMVVETGVHRWDAEQAIGDEMPLPEVVAAAGLDEYAGMWVPRLGAMPAIEVTATDLGRTWVFGSLGPTSEIKGTASDLYLRLMSRPSPVTLPEDWGAAVDALEGPPKP
jgi:uncharacterized protein (TIGR03083 family)